MQCRERKDCKYRGEEYDMCHARLGNKNSRCCIELKLICAGIFLVGIGLILLSCSLR